MNWQNPQISQLFTQLIGEPVTSIVRLDQGISNANFLINNQYVFKAKTPGLDPFADIEHDLAINNLMAALGKAPKVLAASKSEGVIIFAYLSSTTDLHASATDDHLRLVASTLNVLHHTPLISSRKFDVLTRYETYRQLAGLDYLFPAFEIDLLAQFREYFAHSPLVNCHNDIVHGNLLFRDHQLFLIDYEYAGGNDPLFDHLSFLSENNLDQPEIIHQYFYYAYGSNFHLDQAFLDRYLLLLDLLWYYWAKAYFVRTEKAIFDTIAEIKKARIDARLALQL